MTLLASLALPYGYAFEVIGGFGLLGTWVAAACFLMNGKLHTVALAASTIPRSDGLMATGALCAVAASIALAWALPALGVSVPDAPQTSSTLPTLWVGLGAWACGLSLSQIAEARLQRDGRADRLGAARLIRGAVFGTGVLLGGGGGVTELVAAAGASQWAGVLTGLFDWRPRGFVVPARSEWSQGLGVSGSSAILSFGESLRYSLLSTWLPASAFGSYVYFLRIARGSYVWPGQLFVDRNLAAFARLRLGIDPMLRRLPRQVFATTAVTVLAVGAAALVAGWLDSFAPHHAGYAAAVALEVALGFAVALRRSLPVLYRRLRRQVLAELALGAVWLVSTGAATLVLQPSPLAVTCLAVVSTAVGYGLYGWVLRLPPAAPDRATSAPGRTIDPIRQGS